MDAGNTLGAIVFLAAGTWLGWKVWQGRATGFLSAMAGGGNGGSGKTGASPPASTIHGPLAGVVPSAPPTDPLSNPPPAPTVFGDVFGQTGPLSGPQYESPFAPGYTPLQIVLPKLGGWEWLPGQNQ
jgi:hypothetical protein